MKKSLKGFFTLDVVRPKKNNKIYSITNRINLSTLDAPLKNLKFVNIQSALRI